MGCKEVGQWLAAQLTEAEMVVVVAVAVVAGGPADRGRDGGGSAEVAVGSLRWLWCRQGPSRTRFCLVKLRGGGSDGGGVYGGGGVESLRHLVTL